MTERGENKWNSCRRTEYHRLTITHDESLGHKGFTHLHFCICTHFLNGRALYSNIYSTVVPFHCCNLRHFSDDWSVKGNHYRWTLFVSDVCVPCTSFAAVLLVTHFLWCLFFSQFLSLRTDSSNSMTASRNLILCNRKSFENAFRFTKVLRARLLNRPRDIKYITGNYLLV